MLFQTQAFWLHVVLFVLAQKEPKKPRRIPIAPRVFAFPRLPMCNGALFYLLAGCVIRWFRLRFVFWLVCLRSLCRLTAVRFGVQKPSLPKPYCLNILAWCSTSPSMGVLIIVPACMLYLVAVSASRSLNAYPTEPVQLKLYWA